MTEHAATYKELRRSRDDLMVAGVCGGLARYFDVNPTFYRVGFVVLTLLGGAGILIYGAAYLVIPRHGESDSIVTEVLRNRRQRPWGLLGLILVGVAGIVLLSRLSFHVHSGVLFWMIVLIVGAVLLQWQQRSWTYWGSRRPRSTNQGPTAQVAEASAETPATGPLAEQAPAAASAEAPTSVWSPPPAGTWPNQHAYGAEPWRYESRRGTFGIAFGVLVVAGGVLGLLSAAGVHIPWAVALGLGAVAIGFGIVSGALLGRRVGGLAFLGLVLVGAAVVASTVHLHLGGGIGSRSYSPLTAPRAGYRLGIGDLDLDLTNAALGSAQTRITARVGIGKLHVTLPPGVSVRVVGHAGAGDVMLLGHDANGHRVDETVSVPGGVKAPRLVIDATVDIGRVLVTRSVR